MIEQINISFGAKRVWNFSAWVIEARRRRLTSEKRAYTSLKVMKNEHPAFFSEQDDIVNSLHYECIAVIGVAVLPTSDSDRLRVGSVTD